MMKRYRFYLTVGVLVLVVLSMVTMTVNATEDRKLQHENAYYEELEEEYKQILRVTLTDMGYRNAGITMTKIFHEDGNREYTVKLHHQRMDHLSESEKADLLSELSGIGFADGECRINLKFL